MMNRNTSNLLPLGVGHLAPAQLLLLHQQLNGGGAGGPAGLDLFSAAAAAAAQRSVAPQMSGRPVGVQESASNAFSSPFSVNSLLGNSALPAFMPSPEKPPMNANNSQQQQQQQLATALITQHLAAVMTHYRIQQQKQQVQALCQQQQQQQQQQRPALFPLNEPAFQPPPSKKQRSGELVCETLSPSSQPHEHVQMNSSVCSISSPSSSTSSSSSSSASAAQSASSSSSVSYDHHHDLNNFLANLHQHQHQLQQQQQQHSFGINSNLDYLARFSSSLMNGSHMDSGAFSMSSLNDSGESENQQPADFSNRSSPSSRQAPLSLKRSNRRHFDLHNLSCPICGLSLRPVELHSHLEAELEKLDQIKSYYPGSSSSSNNGGRDAASTPSSQHGRKRTLSGSERSSTEAPGSRSRYLNYVKIKESRELRLKNKLRLRLRESSGNEMLKCPLCSESLSGCSKEQINFHLENCASLRPAKRSLAQSATAAANDDNSNNSFDSYEWSNKRERKEQEEFEAELDVVNHDESSCSADPAETARSKFESDDAQKKLESSDSGHSNEMVNSSETELNESRSSSAFEAAKDDDSGVNDDSCPAPADEECLKSASTAQLSAMLAKENSRCSLCSEAYTNALVSTNCWHVYCKGCWTQSLRTKKQCPQCNAPTASKDLRKIFL